MKILVILVTVSLIGYSTACTCAERSPSLIIDDADFYVKVKVVDNGTVSRELRVYEIELLDTYKSESSPFAILQKTYLYTQASSTSCGVTLLQGHCYKLTGSYKTSIVRHRNWFFRLENRMYTGLCELRKPCFELNIPDQTLPTFRPLEKLPPH